MFSTLTQKLLLGVYIFILLSIPIAAYLVSQSQTTKSSASEQGPKTLAPVTPKNATSSARQLLDFSQLAANSKKASDSAIAGATPAPVPSSPTIATSFGPTLSLKVNIEGRPAANQAAKLFVGIAEGALSSNPKFILSFTVDVPASGEYSGLSLAGLTTGSAYTAVLKGSAQIATSSAFTMSPNVTKLNNGQAVNLISGDLNEDNVVNAADYSIAQRAAGSTPSSSKWNENADLNKDGVINTFDLGIIAKNIGLTGSSGTWTSPIPKVATPSASLNSPPAGGPQEDDSGYWMWIPK